MQSVMDKQVAAQESRYKVLEQQYKELLSWREKNETEGLTDEELAAYLAEKSQYEASQKQGEAERKQQEAEYRSQVLSLKQYYMDKGAPREITAIEDPAEMQDKFIDWLNERAAKAEAALKKAPVTDVKKAPDVTTHKPAAGSPGKLSWKDVKLGSKEEADLMARIEAGLVKPEEISA